KCAHWTKTKNEQHQQRNCRAERCATAQQPGNPSVEWMKQPSQQRAEKKRFEERPGDREEQHCNRHHEQQDERRAQIRAADGGWFHGSAAISPIRLIADLPDYTLSFNPPSSWLQQREN